MRVVQVCQVPVGSIAIVRAPDRDRWWLVLRTHHAMTDGHAVSRLLDQFGELLGHLATGAAVDDTPRPLPDPIEHQLPPPAPHSCRVGGDSFGRYSDDAPGHEVRTGRAP
ncbi:MAG: hypothetical protein VXX86_06400 [Planctomycetota bacterium]|nr:hypothetical protein [Planctomycetota bacterium]